MSIPRSIVISVGVAALGAGALCGQTYPQTYPNKPIRIVTAPPGGGTDLATRLVAQGLQGPLGQQLIVENRPSGVIVVETVAKAPPDGYTLLLYTNGLWLLPLMQKVPYDAVKDFSPITLVGNTPHVLVVHPSLPVKSVKELIALAKARPGELNFAAGSTGSAPHLAGELFKAMAGIKIVHIPYKGSADSTIAVIGGHVQLSFSSAPAVMPHVKSKKLKPLAVTSAEPSELAPGMPTVVASGLPGFEAGTIYSVLAPAKTPAAIVAQLNREIVLVLSSNETKRKLLDGGIEAVSSAPEQLAATMSSETIRMGKVIKDAGIRAE